MIMTTMGFGYDPKSKDYKVINIGFSGWEYFEVGNKVDRTGHNIYKFGYKTYHTPKAAIYTLGTDSWREIKIDSLETETTIRRTKHMTVKLTFGIWVMDEFGGSKGAWTKHMTVKLTETPLAFWRNDEILMVDKYGRVASSYNLDTKNLNYLPIQSQQESFEVVGLPNYFAAVYVNSIVSVLGGNKATCLREEIDNSSNI